MTSDRQRAEIDRNYDVFQRKLAQLLVENRDRYALMRSGEVVEIFDRPGEAYDAGMALYTDSIFSIQEITDEVIDLGFFSHVLH